MKFRVKKILTEKQVRKAKWSIVACALVTAVQFGAMYMTDANPMVADPNAATYYERANGDAGTNEWEQATFTKNANGKFEYKREDGTTSEYNLMEIDNYPRGRIVKFANSEALCNGKSNIGALEL
jgi:hypothetical protein